MVLQQVLAAASAAAAVAPPHIHSHSLTGLLAQNTIIPARESPDQSAKCTQGRIFFTLCFILHDIIDLNVQTDAQKNKKDGAVPLKEQI